MTKKTRPNNVLTGKVYPFAFFSRRNSKCFVASSHLVVVDNDHLDSYQEAVEMRR